MALRFITSHDPAHLLRAAADAFLAPRPASATTAFPTVPYLLALRQGALRDDLLDLAAQSGIPGWFDPPLCIFHELPRRLGIAERAVLGDYERVVLIARILRDTGSGVFSSLPRPDLFADAVDALFGEMISNGVMPRVFRAALDNREDRDEFEKKRDADLVLAYDAYLNLLTRLGKADGRDEWQYCAAEIFAGRAPLSQALGGRRQIRIFGLADLRRGWRRFLHALAESPDIDDVIVYSTTASLDLGAPAEHVPATNHEDTASFASIAARLFADNSLEPQQSPLPEIISAPDVEREHDEIARRVRTMIDAGAAPNRIAIVSRKARPHVDYAVAALARAGVPAMARQRFTLATIPAIRAIRTLFKAAAEGWTRGGLVEIARQPYIACTIEPRVVNYIGYRRRVTGVEEWEKELRKLESDAREHEARLAEGHVETDERSHPAPPAAMVTATREAFGRFAQSARSLDHDRPMTDWLDWLGQALARDTFRIRQNSHTIAAERFDVARRDLAALDGVVEIVHQWREALAESSLAADARPVTLERFHEELTAFLSGDAALWTPACQGVQVLEGPAAAYRCFDHLFIVGMEAGAFPTQSPRSCILDETEREVLAANGLPIDTPAVWDDREQELFRVLVAGARRSLTLSYARLDELGREVVKSSFVEALSDVVVCADAEIPTSKVVIEGMPLFASPMALDQARHGATIERIRAARMPSRYDGQIESPDLIEWLAAEFGDDRLWSPTQLEEFAKCPWAYFSKRVLRLEQLCDPDQDMDPATRGGVLHLALSHFYKTAKMHVGGPLFLVRADLPWVEPMLVAALDQALDESSWKWLGHPVLRPAHRAELWRILHGFIAWEMQLHFDMTDPATKKKNAPKMIRTAADEHELAFDDMIFERDGVRIRYRGSIDRVDVSVDTRAPNARFVAAIDYKSSIYSTPGGGKPAAWSDGVVLQVPLYAHALEALRPGYSIARVEYETLKNPERVHSLELFTIDKKTQVLDEDDEARTKWQGALDHAVAHVKRARNGDFRADPPASCNCPPWCHGRDICRVPGGPRELR